MSDKERFGEVPTSGAARPGPVGLIPQVRIAYGVRPIAMRIPSIQVDTTVERRPIVDGVMADPTGPWVICWYGKTGKIGVPGNPVFAGHVDFTGVGPAVLQRAGELVEGDSIEVTGEDVKLYRYAVEWNRLYDVANAPLDEIIGPTDNEAITLITCGGTFDAVAQEYLQRRIIRAHRIR